MTINQKINEGLVNLFIRKVYHILNFNHSPFLANGVRVVESGWKRLRMVGKNRIPNSVREKVTP